MPAPLTQIAPLARGLAAYAVSEVAAKASRLLVVVAVARSMDASQIGLAAAAIAVGDILKSLTETGVNQRIMAAREADLEATCATARRIFLVWCIGLCLLQLGVAAVLWLSGAPHAVAGLVVLLALEYLFMPAGLVQAALAMREGKLRQTAAIAGAQVVGANLISAVLALVWPSALALVLPRLLAAPIWLVAMRRLRPWRVDRAAGLAPLGPFLAYGWAVLGVEVVRALRLQADKLVVGALLGAEALGLYFMAFNAGLGLATSFSTAFATVLFPHLCTATDRAGALRQGMVLALCGITPLVVVQALLAPWYVPVLFGAGWSDLSDVVAILCLAAIPATLWTAAAGWLRASNRPGTELAVTVAMTAALLLNTVAMAPHGLVAIAVGYLAVSTVVMTAASLPALAAAFGPRFAKA